MTAAKVWGFVAQLNIEAPNAVLSGSVYTGSSKAGIWIENNTAGVATYKLP